MHTYLPQDRRRALARGEFLPDRTVGAALFADISGFTALTEALRDALGPRRGAEELTSHLDAVYTALIAAVERAGGSVISFAGDAITCWLDDGDGPAAPRALACALAMQQAMRAFRAVALPGGASTALALKVAVATGPARRFAVGDPAIHYIDALAGATVARTAAAEHLALPGEVLVDEPTVAVLGAALTVGAWRTDAESGAHFAVVAQLKENATLPALADPPLAPDAAASWVPRAVYAREQSGQGAFLTEFRPCVALFVRFVGIDYDLDEAESQLDAFIRLVQARVARYDAALMQVTIGDKGSYLYLTLGALSAHEDDARRAVKLALELRDAAGALGTLAPLQVGIGQGPMRVGAYGGATRRTYGALGDAVNLAARLMLAAAPGEVMVSNEVQRAVAEAFDVEPRPPLPLKGKAEPLPVFAVAGARQQRAIRLQEPHYALPMVGRQAELQTIADALRLAAAGRAQVVGVVAEAGLGKSRLLAEVIRLARRMGFSGYGGACQSDGLHTPYLAWKPIWGAFFDLDPAAPLRRQLRALESELDDRAPARLQALPLLGPLLHLAIPENDFTTTLEPKDRKGALHALLEDCLKAAAHEGPLLIVVEDLHWVDALSLELLVELARALITCPVCFVLAYRPAPAMAARLAGLPAFTELALRELTAAEGAQAIRAKLAQLYPARGGAVPPSLVAQLMARSQGNAFYLEELLNYLRDRGLDPRDPAALGQIALPDSLHTLILSRIDQLSERERTTLRVASVIGRLFRAAWLTGYYPALGAPPAVRADLEALHALDITPRDTPEPDLAYLFKHIVTHEVTYESLPYATRAHLHELLAVYLETVGAPVDVIAHHYGQSENRDKQREYWRKAGAAAQAAYANEAALDSYARLLPLLTDPAEQIDLQLECGDILSLIGRWVDAEAAYRAALSVAEAVANPVATAHCLNALGTLMGIRGDRGEIDAALSLLEQALAMYAALGNRAGEGRILIKIGRVFWRTGAYVRAREQLDRGLMLAHAVDDQHGVGLALHQMGNVAMDPGPTHLILHWHHV